MYFSMSVVHGIGLIDLIPAWLLGAVDAYLDRHDNGAGGALWSVTFQRGRVDLQNLAYRFQLLVNEWSICHHQFGEKRANQ